MVQPRSSSRRKPGPRNTGFPEEVPGFSLHRIFARPWVPAFAGMTVGEFGAGKGRESQKGDGEIVPVRVRPLNQLDFPVTLPLLHLPLASDRRFYVIERLDVDEALDSIAPSKTADRSDPVLVDTLGKVRGDADVERAVLRLARI